MSYLAMNARRALEGRLEVHFTDGTTFTGVVHREAERVFLCWVNHGGVPNEHLIRPVNQENLQGWIRELGSVFSKSVRTYNFTPRRMMRIGDGQ